MNPYTGEIREFFTEEDKELWEKQLGHKVKRLEDVDAEALQGMDRPRRKNWMRNKPCVCGSGAKFKKCCGKSAV